MSIFRKKIPDTRKVMWYDGIRCTESNILKKHCKYCPLWWLFLCEGNFYEVTYNTPHGEVKKVQNKLDKLFMENKLPFQRLNYEEPHKEHSGGWCD